MDSKLPHMLLGLRQRGSGFPEARFYRFVNHRQRYRLQRL